jgi:hypothetical protein
MKHHLRRCALVLLLTAACVGQIQEPRPEKEPSADVKLPNGKSQRDEILKAEYQQNLKDAAQLAELAQQLHEDLEKNEQYVLSLADLKKTDDIEKLARKIRSRMRRN